MSVCQTYSVGITRCRTCNAPDASIMCALKMIEGVSDVTSFNFLHYLIITLCSALSANSRHPINLSAVQDVFRATVVAKVTCSAPAWSGTCSDWVRHDSFLNRRKRLSFADKDVSSVTELFSDADDAFFERIMTNSEHVLQPFLPEKPGATFSKLLRKILGRFLILGKSLENIWQSTNLNYVIIAQ